ncbi:ribonuclease H family protein, partial [Klebsiella pneumoniae]|uniref:ribonuclease H family protein n=2 Tax=Klebsiella pneumoniae TaxID=573 RepID=UPI00405544A2
MNTFSPGMAGIVEPLSELLKKGKVIVKSPQTEEAIATCKAQLSRPPVLAYPDFTRPFIVTTDTSQVAMGAVMSQLGLDGTERPVEFA